MTQSSRLHGSLYAYSIIIHSWRKASLRQFSHCEWFSRYNEANCAGSEPRWEFMFFQWKERSSQGPPSSDGFEKTINNNCYEGRGEGTTRPGQVRTIDLESQRGNIFDNNTIKEKTVRIWKFDGWKTDLNPAAGLTSFSPDSARDCVCGVTCCQGHYEAFITMSPWVLMLSPDLFSPLARRWPPPPCAGAPSVKCYHGTSSTLPSFHCTIWNLDTQGGHSF